MILKSTGAPSTFAPLRLLCNHVNYYVEERSFLAEGGARETHRGSTDRGEFNKNNEELFVPLRSEDT